VAEDEFRRENAPLQQLLFAVDVLQDKVEQDGPLDHTSFDVDPLGRRHHHRDGVELPGFGPVGIDDPIADAVGGEESPNIFLPLM